MFLLYLNRAADYAGIFIMIPLTSYSISFYPYYCKPKLQLGQMLCVSIPACLNIILAASPLYLKTNKTRLLRTSLTAIVITVALIPCFYDIANNSKVLYMRDMGYCINYFIHCSWCVICVERFYPYIFDNNINSHALMHFFIMTSHLCWYGFKHIRIFPTKSYRISMLINIKN